MLPKKNRLKKKKDFGRIFEEGRGFKENFLFFKMAKNNRKISRFGFMVGKNLSKRATVRNRVRRMISRLVRLKLKDTRSGIDAVFVALPGLERKGLSDLESSINKIFVRAQLIK